jgi:hypothetical protein
MPDNFIYPLADLSNPRGANGAPSLSSFYQRSLYKEKIYPSTFPPPLNVWYDKLLYGRVDQFQNSILPSNGSLRTVPYAAGAHITALPPVCVAFEKFVEHMQRANVVGALFETGNPSIINLEATKAYDSPTPRYTSFAQSLSRAFNRSVTGKVSTRIKDFPSFLEAYGEYLVGVASITPITQTNFLISNKGSMFSSGMSISIATADAGRDDAKYNLFINDPNFEFFRRCAKKFGFTVNKDMPWVLTADLFSPAFKTTALQNFVLNSGAAITKDNFFSTYYDKICLTDFEDLINILVKSYTKLIELSPFYEDEGAGIQKQANIVASVGRLGSGCPIKKYTRKPLNISPQDIISGAAPADTLPIKFLIDLYIDIRQTEVKNPLSRVHLRSVKSQSYEIYQVRPNPDWSRLQNVADYVNTVFRDYVYDLGAMDLQFNNGVNFKLDNRVEGDKILVESNIKRQLY